MRKLGTLLFAAVFISIGIMMTLEDPRKFDEGALYRHTKSSHGRTYYDRIEPGAELASKEPGRITSIKVLGFCLIAFGSVALWVYYKDYIAKSKQT